MFKMTKFEIPQDGYWHCQILAKKYNKWPIEMTDMDFSKLDFDIVQPFRKNKPFIADGTLLKNRTDIDSIKIVHSPEKSEYYGTQSLSTENVFVFYPNITMVFIKGEDWTTRLLYSDESVNNNEGAKDNKSLIEPSFNINIDNRNFQTQSQTQHQEQNFTSENIQQLQDAFADFREEYKKLPNVDDSLLQETQDSLDALSKDSSLEEKNKAFNKVRRVLKKAKELFNNIGNIGEKAIKVFTAYEALKKIYDILSPYLQS